VKGKLKKIILSFRKWRELLIVIVAAVLLELLSAAQYYYTRHLMEEQLEARAEMELTTKAIITKGIINDSERTLKSHIMWAKNSLANPDSLFTVVTWIAKYSPHLKGCGIAFTPHYYEEKGRLFEPYALKTDSGIQRLQVAGARFDYTKDGFYRDIQKKKASSWVGPYDDVYLGKRLISFAVPIYELSGDTVAVLGVDIDTQVLGDTLNYRHIYPSSFDFLLTEEGELIAGPVVPQIQKDMADVIRLIGDSTVVRQKSRSGRSTLLRIRTGDRKGFVFYANMKGEPRWQLGVVCYDDEVYAPLSKIRIRMLLLSLLAFAILLFVIRSFARNEKELHLKTLEHERTTSELRVAADIQQTLLPADEPSLKDIDEAKVEGRLIPAKAVGGDLYNAFVRDGKLFFCIGDVSGKGIPAALIMAITQALFRSVASREDNPASIMKRLNETACRNNKTNIFATLFIGVLDLPTGHLRYCNAGHELPILHSSFIEAVPNLPIGLFEDFNYEMQTTAMEPGTSLFLYTDGLTEARNAKGKLFGRDRVLKMIETCGSADPKQLVETVVSQWQRFIGNTEQSDDLTLLAVSYTPPEEQSIMGEGITLQNDVKEVAALGSFVKQVAEHLSLDGALAGKLRLAVEEAVVNVMEYAYPSDTKGNVRIEARSDGKRLKFIITDSGIPFNPTIVSAADTTLSAEERPIGGLGILLVRQLMDSVNYERIDGKNVLTLSKKILS